MARSPRSSKGEAEGKGALWTALSLAARSAALAGLVSLALVVAVIAWLVLRAALSVDPLVGRERVWLQYGQHRPPYALVPLQKGKYNTPGQVYDIALDVTVPVNTNNLELGNFMASVSLVDSAGEHVLNASRPAILSHPSAQACHTPSSSRSSTLSKLLFYPMTLLTSSALPAVSCLAPFVAPSPSSPCMETLRIPILERASLVAPSSSFIPPRTKSLWRRPKARPASTGPATALFVQIGRDDAHPLPGERPGEVEDVSGGQVQRQEARPRPRELQVVEAWVRVELRLGGVRAFVHRHPYLLFATFFPSFVALELCAALAVYALYVARAEPAHVAGMEARRVKREAPVGGWEAREEEEEVKPPVSPTYPLSPPQEGHYPADIERTIAAAQRRAQRMRLGPGGVGMSEAFAPEGTEGEGEGEGETEELEAEGTDVGESVSEGGALAGEEEERVQIKEEAEEEEEGTVAGSATTRRTASTFGPSLAGTASTRATGLSAGASAAGIRERAVGERAGHEE